jgi:hypothetical protein
VLYRVFKDKATTPGRSFVESQLANRGEQTGKAPWRCGLGFQLTMTADFVE